MTTLDMEKGFQEIWKLFNETSEKFKETDKMFKETEKRFKETDDRFKEIEKRFKETDERFKETDKQFKETDKRFRETDERFKVTDRELERLEITSEKALKAVYALTGKWSRFVEGLIAPAVERLFQEWGIEVDKVFQRVKTHKNGDEMEVDILAINGEYAVLIEAKSTLCVDDVKEHLERLERFKVFFPEYKERKAVGAVGGIVMEGDSDKFAYRNGLFVIGESGENAMILNDKKFKPKVW